VFTKFDLEQRPVAGTVAGHDGQPPQSVSIAYDGGGGDTWTLQDQTTLMHNANGTLVEERLPDGTVYTKFDAQQRPIAGVVAARDGGPSQAVTIAYQDDGTGVWTYQDQTQVIVNPGGAVIRETTPDGWSFDSFDSQGRPTAGTNNGLSAKITYDSTDSSCWTLNDGTVLYRNSAGTLVRETTSDGMEFTSFDGSGRPVGGTVPDVSGTGRSPVDISYTPDGSSVWQISGGPTLYRDSGGTVTREVTPDGWTFTSFNSDGLPTAGVNSNGVTTKISYVGDNSIWTLGDGTIVTHDKSGATVRVETPEGGVFTSFDTLNRPIAGTVPDEKGGPPLAVTIRYTPDGGSVWDVGGAEIFKDANDKTFKMNADGWTFANYNGNGDPTTADNGNLHADIAYPGDGTSVWRYKDGTVVTRGASGQILTLVDPDGWTFNVFDTAERPIAGHKGDETVTITYQDNGWSVWDYGDVQVTRDTNNTIKLETTADGWTFDSFDALGRPLTGKNGGMTATIVYDSDLLDSGSTWTYGGTDGGTVVHRAGDGTVTSMTTPDGWEFTVFDSLNRPVAGHKDGKNVTIKYEANGNSIWDFGAGEPILTYDKNGNLLTMQTPDGWLFDAFNGTKPTHGYNKDLNVSVDIYYNPDGTAEWDFSDGSTLITDSNGTPIEEIIPDGKGGWVDIVFAVDLAVMEKVITYTQQNQQTILDALGRIKDKVQTITWDWTGPAASRYAHVVSQINKVTNDFTDIFGKAVTRLQTAYNSYLEVEGTNYRNLQPPPPHNQWHRPPPLQVGPMSGP
jgi:uncharacterized protein YukE